MVEPSRTSQAVALIRAGLTRPHTADGDPEAQGRLTAASAPAAGPRWWPTCRPGRRSSTTRCCPPWLPG